ncbi:MAG: glycosyltransferase family 4 protein [Microthrixaceae bacterium]|nr:glycosyltransferase family 4 protein [Microthrixaceae bacterium]
MTDMSSAPLHVGVNLLWLVPGVVGGSEEYTVRSLNALHRRGDRSSEVGPPIRVTLFALRQFAEAHPDLAARYPVVAADTDGHSRAERVAREATWLPRALERHGVDLVHHAGGVVPPGPLSARTPSVLTIHDLQPLVMPENFSPVKRRWLATMLPRSVGRTRLVFTPSDPASASVVDLLGMPPERVVTVPHGVEPPAVITSERRAEVRARYGLSGPTVLYPAIPYRHKDHATLVEAFARLAATRPEVTLVLAGGPGPVEAELAAHIRASGVGAQVRRTGRVPWADLEVLYDLATVVAVPSRFEGFGAPALEAMAAGRPLVAADATALPWVVGSGGLLVDPGDVDAWARTVADVLDDPALQHRLSTAAKARAATFTWDRTADALAAGYLRAGAMGEDGGR